MRPIPELAVVSAFCAAPDSRWRRKNPTFNAEPAEIAENLQEKDSARSAFSCVFSIVTRLPPEFRLTPSDAAVLLHQEVLSRMAVHDLPAADRTPMLRAAARDSTAGGRIYDAHIAEVARAAGADVVVTDNRRHFLAALRHGMRVETPGEFVAALKTKRT